MKDFSDLSDDELLEQLDFLSLELSCIMGHGDYEMVEGLYWRVMEELKKRGINHITGEVEYCVEGDYEDDYEDEEVNSKNNFKGCFDGGDGGDGLDLPF